MDGIVSGRPNRPAESLRVRVRPAPLRLRGLGLQPQGRRQCAELAGRVHEAKHPLYRSFFQFPDGPPPTSHELNGWGDDIVHDYLRAVEHRGRVGVLYSNKDYGCEWDYDWRNKRFQREDNTRFAVNVVVYAMTS